MLRKWSMGRITCLVLCEKEQRIKDEGDYWGEKESWWGGSHSGWLLLTTGPQYDDLFIRHFLSFTWWLPCFHTVPFQCCQRLRTIKSPYVKLPGSVNGLSSPPTFAPKHNNKSVVRHGCGLAPQWAPTHQLLGVYVTSCIGLKMKVFRWLYSYYNFNSNTVQQWCVTGMLQMQVRCVSYAWQ